MKSETRNYSIGLPISEIIYIIGDLERYAKVHPLIISAERVSGHQNRFLIRERPFRFLPVRTHYYAEGHFSPGVIQYEITGIFLTTAFMEYKFDEASPSETQIEWSVKVESKLPIETWLSSKMVKAQNSLMNKVRQVYLSKED